jgi:hypothetical protein
MRKKLIFLAAILIVALVGGAAPREAAAAARCIIYLADIEGGGTAICVSCPDWDTVHCYGQ